MTALSETLLRKCYANSPHPYRLYEEHVDVNLLTPDSVLLDAGCGRTVPVLRKYLGRARRLIGIELVSFSDVPPGIETYNADLSDMPLPDASVDLIMSRSVFEHLTDPAAVYKEFARVLRPGGVLVFLTANMWDYGTLVARLVPNRFHSQDRQARWKEGRKRTLFRPPIGPIHSCRCGTSGERRLGSL
jgi:SAM-dependent methyltransferase